MSIDTETWRDKIERAIFIAVLVALGVVAYARAHPATLPFFQPWAFEATVFDVGQGDSIFIKTADGKQMLIDGGPDDTVLAKLGTAMPFWDRDLDVVVLTHPHADHASGLVSVLRQYEVGEVWYTGVVYPTDAYLAFLDELRARNIVTKIIDQAETFNFGDSVVSILYPAASLDGASVDSLNDSSIVMKMEYGDQSLLVTGDVEALVEQTLVSSGNDLQSTVFKVAHHGSRTSSSEEFLDEVRPRYAVISVGENGYGHPHTDVMRRLQNRGGRVLRTDEMGDIFIRIFEKGLCVFESSRILECDNL